MASPSTLIEIDEVFFTCPMCCKSFKDPRQLPCLHRYCNDCLQSSIEGGESTFTCPLCKKICSLPREGPEGFKTDAHMERMVQFHLIHKAIAEDTDKDCVGCSKLKPFVSYCFKCKGFLCTGCNEFHLTNRMVEDHKQKLLTLEGCDEKDYTLERFYSLSDKPECDVHGELLTMCCVTCSNLPTCASCLDEDHVGHDIHPVEMVANAERERINNKLQVLKHQRKLVYKLKKRADQAKAELQANVASKRERIQAVYERQAGEIKLRLEENRTELERGQAEVNEDEKCVIAEFNQKMNDELIAVQEKYERIFAQIVIENGNKKDRLKRHHERLDEMISSKGNILDNYYNDLSTDMETKEKQNLSEIEEIQEHSTNTIMRLENLDVSAASILSSENSWTDARCLPDVSTAAEDLIIDVVKDFPGVDDLADFDVDELPLINVDNGTISESPGCVDIDGINSKGWEVNCMSTSRDECVVVTGKATEDYSHITVVDLAGVAQRQDRRKKSRASVHMPFRYCAHLDETRFATACQTLWDDIGIYDIRNGSYVKKDVANVPSTSRFNWQVSCIATDPVRNRLLVGNFNKSDIYVFDDKVKYVRTITLPDVIKWPRAIAVFNGSMLVCDDDNRTAYVVAMPTTETEKECKTLCEIPKPGSPDNDCSPLSVCTDSRGYIYILWDVMVGGYLSSVMTQYSKNGRQLLTKRQVDGNSRCLTTARSDDGEKLLIATERSGKMYIYHLSTSNEEQD